jgi:hypothetical protein
MSFSLLFAVSKNDFGKQRHEYRQLNWLDFNQEE